MGDASCSNEWFPHQGDASVVGYSHQGDASISNEWLLHQSDASISNAFPHQGDASVTTLPNTTPTPTRPGTLG